MQRDSFIFFLKKGLIQELKIIKEYKSFSVSDLEVDFSVDRLKYKKSKKSLKACLEENLTYSINLYVPVKVTYNKRIILK
jgi:DNA-directed RNA polymerase beta subunit